MIARTHPILSHREMLTPRSAPGKSLLSSETRCQKVLGLPSTSGLAGTITGTPNTASPPALKSALYRANTVSI